MLGPPRARRLVVASPGARVAGPFEVPSGARHKLLGGRRIRTADPIDETRGALAAQGDDWGAAVGDDDRAVGPLGPGEWLVGQAVAGVHRTTIPTMSRRLKVGVQLPEVERVVPWPELRDLAQTAERIGLAIPGRCAPSQNEGVSHAQLVLDPISVETIAALRPALATLDA